MGSQEFHDLANVTLREETRELRLRAQDARARADAHAVQAAYSVERALLAAEWVARVAARPRLPA
jgi:hypothetical protein